MGLLRARPGKVEPRFLLYAYLGPQFQEMLRSRTVHGSTVDRIPLIEMPGFPIRLPKEQATQRAIACILGSLDDKIELNRRMNRTLEEMARAIFKSWFIDFDPVRAKARVRREHPKWTDDQVSRAACPKLKPEIARLFPDSFEDSELGEIPKGWAARTLADLAELNPESWSKETAPDWIEYVDLSNTKRGVIESTTEFSWESAPSRAQRVLRPGDTIIGTVRPGNCSYALISRNGLTGSTGFAALRPHRPEFEEFVYLAATYPENIDRLAHLADGAAYPAVRPEVVLNSPTVRSPDQVLREFHRITDPMLAKIAAQSTQSRTLAALRDALLPKLISGQLRIRDAERIVQRKV
jgi:type I restriction enzyme S subunit